MEVKELPVRLGGIFALWRLAEDSPARDEKTVWDILSAFIRNPPHEPEFTESPDYIPTVRPDIQAILNLLGTEAAARKRDSANYVLNLAQSNLRQADLIGADLSRADLSAANLAYADLSDADLTVVNLIKADLTDADLSGANLSGANLTEANLSTAVNLSQGQLDTACAFDIGRPPIVPDGLTPPKNVYGK